LAVGAHDSCIILYNATTAFSRISVLRGHHSTIECLDFSLDGNTIMSNCTSYEILFFDARTGKQNPSGASAFRDETWATWSCKLGWPVQGIWPPCSKGSDINAVDRSPDGIVEATVENSGLVKLFKYPCPSDRASFNQYLGHSSHATNVRFLKTSPYLISTGGNDKCVFQWKYNLDNESVQQSTKVAQAAPGQISSIQADIADPSFVKPVPQKKKAQPT
jgi:WD40 repeat protein